MPKRKSNAVEDPSQSVDLDEIDIPDGTPMESPDVVRRKINAFIESGEMKVGEFCDTLGVSGNSYRNFLGQHGRTKGLESDTYHEAWVFFKKREVAGLKMPNKKRKTQAAGSASGSKGGPAPDLGDIHLRGEENDGVEVYDTCDEIRRKINAYLRKPGVTQAQFLRDLHAQYHAAKAPKSIQSTQLNAFRNNRGPTKGNTSSVYYSAYVFFEKIRIKQGKPKSKHREEMESIYGPSGGMDTDRRQDGGVWVMAGKTPYQDKYGQVFTV